MLLFGTTVAAGALAYYLLRGESEDQDGSTPGGPKGTAKRNRQSRRRGPEESAGPDPRENARDAGPDVHRQKVDRVVEEKLRRADARAENLLERGQAEALAWESRFLSVSCKKMFASGEFFGQGQRFDSYQAALQAAEGARDKLIERRRQAARQKEMAGAPGPGHIENQYLRHAAESALMIGWCAGGLVGRSQLGAAQELFCVSVSREDTRSWTQFDQVLRKEREHCLARLQDRSGPERQAQKDRLRGD